MGGPATRWFDRSALGRIPFVACQHHDVLARASLACAQQVRPARREEMLHEIETSIETIGRPRGLD
ncbi:MAG: hypothetical protein ACYC8T_26330 [Myxococcaceae bacterium]